MTFENRYSAVDRMMHRLAFANPGGQRVMAELEDQLFRSQLDRIETRHPVFVTALPRAGTTLLLEILASLDEFASHSYRNMPFVLCPVLWNRLSSRHQRKERGQERAHQDGMLVDVDSPEAFEEMLWMPFWKDHYATDRILPWLEGDDEFFEFFRSHMKKMILLAGPADGPHRRYLSKNNLNVARIEILSAEFEDASFVVPFRAPLQHAASLLRQHVNFLALHRQDRFARRYMAGIGHFDFGLNFRPVDFDGWLDRASTRDPETLSFWLAYWLATYERLARTDRVTLICYEDLCANPRTALEALAGILEIHDRDALVAQHSRFRNSAPHPIDLDGEASSLVDRAEELYQALRREALTAGV